MMFFFLFLLQSTHSHDVPIGQMTEALNSINRPAVIACSTASSSGTPSDKAVQWSLENVQNIQAIPEANRGSLYHLVETFYCRITGWKNYRSFYDRLFSQPDISRAYPDALPQNQVDQGLFLKL